MRVSNELGAGHPKSAAFSVIVVNTVSLIIAVVEAVVVLALRRVLSYAFTDGETVANAVSDLCPYLAVTLILNGIQPVLSGNRLRPYTDQDIIFVTFLLVLYMLIYILFLRQI